MHFSNEICSFPQKWSIHALPSDGERKHTEILTFSTHNTSHSPAISSHFSCVMVTLKISSIIAPVRESVAHGG